MRRLDNKPRHTENLFYSVYPPCKNELYERSCRLMRRMKSKKVEALRRNGLVDENGFPENAIITHSYDVLLNKHKYILCFYHDGSEIDRSRFGTTYALEDLK